VVYRYRLFDEETERDLGPFVSPRLAFQVGETLARRASERYEIARVVPAEDGEPFRAYLIVRGLGVSDHNAADRQRFLLQGGHMSETDTETATQQGGDDNGGEQGGGEQGGSGSDQ
jgi:hypothetical protein